MTTNPIPEIKGRLLIGVAPAFSENPPVFMTEAVDNRDIVQFKMFGKRIFIAAAPELVHEVLVTQYQNFPKGDRSAKIMSKFIGKGLVTYTDVEHHRQMRRLAQPAFHMKRVVSYADVMVDYADAVSAEWRSGEVVDISEEMMKLTMYIVSKTLFDVGKDDMAATAERVGAAIDEIQQLANDALESPFLLPDWLPTQANRSARSNRAVLNETIDRMVAERVNADGSVDDRGDLLSMYLLAEFEDGGRISAETLRDELITLFSAGHETTANTLTWTLFLLSQHPDVAERLRAELDTVLAGRLPTFEDLAKLPYLEMVIKESMRVRPPVWGLVVREALEDAQIGDYAIPKGGLIFVSPYATHRLERYFPDPERFDPERFTPEAEAALPKYAYIPFGGGPRVCIGNRFAMMEAQLVLATLFQRFEFELARPLPVELNPQITMSPLGGMAMRVVARTTAETQTDAASISAVA